MTQLYAWAVGLIIEMQFDFAEVRFRMTRCGAPQVRGGGVSEKNRVNLYRRTPLCVLMSVIAPKLGYAGEVWEGNVYGRIRAGNSTDDSS